MEAKVTYEARVIADSLSDEQRRLTTMVITFPRIVLAEFNTHRALSRNSASSRAIPVRKQLDRIRECPFVPTYWGAAQKGMQAHEELSPARQDKARKAWLTARDGAIEQAERMLEMGLHKQLVNRILEPFMWHTVIVTATEWGNFFALRANPDAQPEIRTIALMMRKAYRESKPEHVAEGQWHLPLIQPEERDGKFEFSEAARKISAARCARVSYLTHDGQRDVDADLRLYTRLVTGGHMSPLEHVATPFTERQRQLRRDTADYIARAMARQEFAPHEIEQFTAQQEFNGNFCGWTQLRKEIWGEHDFGLMPH